MRRFAGVVVVLILSGCAMHAARVTTEVPPARPVAVANPAPEATPARAPDAGALPTQPDPKAVALPVTPDAGVETAEVSDGGDDADSGSDSDSDEGPEAVDEEAESHDAPADAGVAGYRYTADLSDAQLTELWKSSPEKLGSISIGFTDEGRMINSVQFPRGANWIVVSPERTWGTQETIDDVLRAIKTVLAQYPDSPPLRVNQISARDGGYLRPHKSHQSGRDVDLAFYYPTAEPVRARAREKYIDVKRTWALLRALITGSDVQKVLLDRHVQKVLYDYALKSGEDKAWLDSIFHGGRSSLVVHARGHRDHMHVRFFNGRAQELGRRVAPLLALHPEQNLAFHRVHSGDTLGAIARRYNTTVVLLRRANHMRGSMLHLKQVLTVPLRGPCTRCPVPPAVEVPPRRLPPQQVASMQPEVAAHTSAVAPGPIVSAASAVAVSSSVEPVVMKVSASAPPMAGSPTANSVPGAKPATSSSAAAPSGGNAPAPRAASPAARSVSAPMVSSPPTASPSRQG